MTWQWKGIIEGFYGPPWTEAARRTLIQFAGSQGFNTYLYGPKDDPGFRRQWREPFSEVALQYWRSLMDEARPWGIEMGFALSPGLDLRMGDIDDQQALLAKFLGWHHLGVRCFALLWDDIPIAVGPEDRDGQYRVGVAQAEVTNAVYARLQDLGDPLTFWFCPTEYWGISDSPYRMALKETLDSEIAIFWTGPNICSLSISSEMVARFAEEVGHRVVIWDNYPVNDAEMTQELHLGPLDRRDPALSEVVEGYFTNPMDRVEASCLPLRTVAQYLADPYGYEVEAAWNRALQVYDPPVREVLRQVGWATRESCCGQGGPLQQALEQAWWAGERTLPSEVMREVAAWGELAWTALPPRLAEELRPWTTVMRLQAAWAKAWMERNEGAMHQAYTAGQGRSARVLGGMMTRWQAKMVGVQGRGRAEACPRSIPH